MPSAEFEKARQDLENSTAKADNAMKLRLYAYYKQATDGDNTGSRPGMTNPVGRAKYDAWAKLKGMSNQDAEAAYIAEVGKLGS